jgi:serine/threonine-protein kinase SRPK3
MYPFSVDLKPTNILLELDSPDKVISQYLSVVPPRMTGPQNGTPLREVITTPPFSGTRDPRIRIIDFGVGRCSRS